MRFRQTGASSVRIAIAAVGLLLAAPFAVAEADPERDVHWSNWKTLGSGFVGRQRVAPNAEQPVESRRLATTQTRGRGKGAEGAEGAAFVQSAVQPLLAARNERVTAAWLRTGAAGLYRASVSEIANVLGKRVSQVRNKARRGKLSLVNAGKRVSWYFDSAADRILFAGEVYDTFYTDENAYRLWLGGKSAKPMAVVSSTATSEVGEARAFPDTLAFEEEPDFFYSTWAVAAEPDADYWFWDYLYGGYKDEIELDLHIPNPALDGSAQLRITMRGWTDMEPGDEHQVHAELNGEPVGDLTWDGFQEVVLVANIDQSLLSPSGDNILRLTNDYAPGTHPGQYLDAIEIDYLRQPVAVDGMLWMHAVAAGVQTATGFASDEILVIESPNSAAVVRQDLRIEGDAAGGWSVTFETAGGADYLIAERNAVEAPALAPDFRSRLRKAANRADYLIIAPPEFAGTAEALAEYRRSRFSDTKIVWLDDIYDEFSSGREDPSAIGRFMRRALKAWRVAPSFVTLIGKGSLDHKDRMGYGDSFLPVLMTDTPWALAASDERLLGVYGDAPFAVGRLPITNDSEGMAYVEKLIAYEAALPGDDSYAAVVVADNADNAGDFPANSDLLADRLLDEFGFDQVTPLYHPIDDVRTNLTDFATWEAGYVSYDGHGSSTQIGNGKENFIKVKDAEVLGNATYPIFAALTCAAGDDTNPGTRSLAGALVLNPAGGAIASLAPTGLSLDADAQLLSMAFIDNLFVADATIGEAARQAKAQTGGSISAFMPRMYSVIGEPVVQARQGGN